MSDVPALVWCTAAVLCAQRSRRRDLWALGSGAALALAVLVRPSNLLVLPPVALALGWSPRRWSWFALGGAPGALLLGWFNSALYGTAFKSGYGDIGSVFSRDNVPSALFNYVRWMPVLLTPGLLLVGALPWLARRESGRMVAILAAWILGFLGFYAFYYHTHESWWYLRFLLPAFPALILAMLLAGRALSRRWPTKARLTLGVLAGLATLVWASVWSHHLRALKTGREEKVYRESANWAQAHLPHNAVLVAFQTSGALLYYTNFTFVRWDQFFPATPLTFSSVERACVAAGRPVYAMLFPYEIAEKKALELHLPGRWTKIGEVQQVTIWRHDEPPATAP